MKEKYIANPRPIWKPKDDDNKSRSMVFGSKTAGIVARITKEGLELNGYYRGITQDLLFGVLREFAFIEWKDLEKLKEAILRGKKKKKEVDETPDEVDTDPDMEYISKLSVVTINGRKFYVDPERRENRPVDFPGHVFKWREVLG